MILRIIVRARQNYVKCMTYIKHLVNNSCFLLCYGYKLYNWFIVEES